MSTNISKQKRDALLDKINQIKNYISAAPQDENTANLLTYIGELTKEINGKKYGLVFEEHREKIDELLEENAPVLVEQEDLFIDNGGEMNFLIEGDNLAALKLLEKTHKGKIDVIYIDPPYNTGNSFIYDDKIIGDDDEFKHSKYASFISERLHKAKNLLSPNGLIFISIDDKEFFVIKSLCDEIFSEKRFLTTIGWEKRTKCQNTDTARKMLQPKIEYILVYKNNDKRIEFNCHIIGQKEYPELDDKGCYRSEEIGQMGASGIRGRGSMIFPILNILPREGNQWKIGKETVKEFLDRNDIYEIKGKLFRKIRPSDESSDSIKPFWGFFNAEQYGTAESAKKQLSDILGTKEHGFETVKPVQLIEELIYQAGQRESTILDFFAGSGTTGESTLASNRDYNSKHKFILCTNNQNNICRDITYQRLKNVMEKDKYPASLKYFKIDYLPIKDKMYYEYADELLEHVKELVELENAIDFNTNKSVAIVLDDDELAEFVENIADYPECKTLYMGHDVLTSYQQEKIIKAHGITINTVPDYYYRDLAN